METKKKRKAVVRQNDSLQSGLWWLLAAIIAIQIAFEAYGPSLRGPFVFDDFSLPFYNPQRLVEDVGAWIRGVRPVLMFSYWVNYHFGGRDPYSYHVLNVFIHLANAALVFWIAATMLQPLPANQVRKRLAATFCGALFLLHPIQTESVAYIAGRSESLSALFLLSAVLLFLHASPNGIGWLRSAAVILLFALATAAKEQAAILPVAFLLIDWYRNRDAPFNAIRRNVRLYAPLTLVAPFALFFVWRVLSTSRSAGFHLPDVSWYNYFFTECGVLLTYLRLCLLPIGQNIDYNVPFVSAPNLMTIAGAVTAVGLLILAWRCRQRRPLVTFGILLFFIFLAPTSSFIPIKDPIAERRLYLPLIGMLLSFAGFLLQSKLSRTELSTLGSVVLVLAGFLTYQRSRVWSSEVALWEDALAKFPGNLRGYPHLVHGYVSEHRCTEALHRLDTLSQQIPVDATLLVHWAFAYECVNRPDEALRKLQRAAELAPDANIEMKIATDNIKLNRIEDALSALTQALALDPSLDSAYVTRGELYAQLGQIPLAVQNYREALRVNPGNSRARMRLQSLTGEPWS